MQLKQHCMLI